MDNYQDTVQEERFTFGGQKISIVLPHRNYHDREDLEPRISRMSQIAIAKHRCNPCHLWLAFWLRLEAALCKRN